MAEKHEKKEDDVCTLFLKDGCKIVGPLHCNTSKVTTEAFVGVVELKWDSVASLKFEDEECNAAITMRNGNIVNVHFIPEDKLSVTTVLGVLEPSFAQVRELVLVSSKEIVLECPNDFAGGLMNWLATKNGTEAYKNPMLRGDVEVTSTTWMVDADPIHWVVGNEVKRCVTKAEENQNIQIQLKTHSIKPTHYLLRHYISWNTEALRNWRFEASTNGVDWVALRVHNDDSSLEKIGQWHIWDLPNVNDYYSYFRIVQTGNNSNAHLYLACSGFELWGSLRPLA